MAKKTISELSAEIQSYAAKTEPLSIDPILDGGIKKDILDTLNNKAYNSAYLRLSSLPVPVTPTSEIGANGEYYITQGGSFTNALLFKKEAGVWNAKTATNDLTFFFDAVDGTRYYYAFSDDLTAAIQTHSINLANPTGTAVLTTPQDLTEEEKIQAQTNIDAASKSYIDNAIAALRNSGAVGSSVAGSVMPWFGTETSIPQNWMLIPNEETFLLKSEYPDLYEALGGEDNVFGVTETLFALPYLSGGTSIIHTSELFPLGQKGGEETHVLDITEMPEHSHIINLDDASGVEETGINAVNANSIVSGSVQTENSGGGLAHNNMPPYIAANYIIKTKNAGGSFTASVNEENHLILTFSDGSVQDAGLINIPKNSNYISGNSTTTVTKFATLVELDIDSSEENPISYYCRLVINKIAGAVSPPIALSTEGNSIEIYGNTKWVAGGFLMPFNLGVRAYLYGGGFFHPYGDKLSFSWGENNEGGKLWIIIPAPMHSFRVEAFASKRALENENIEKEYVENIVTRIIPIDYNEAFAPVPFIKHITDLDGVYLNVAKIPAINISSGDETKFLNEKGLFSKPAGVSDAVNYITGATSGAIYYILKGMNVITNCLSAGTHIFNLPTPIEGIENLMTVKFRTCSTAAPTITREIPKLTGVGTISNTANSPILTGVGTTFTELRDGDKIYFDGAEREILSIESDTQITLVNDVVDANSDITWEYFTPIRVFGGVEPVWGLSEVRTIFYEYVKYGNTWYLEISYSSNAN